MHQHEVDLPHAEITAPIIGAFYDVYRELGYGFSELVYRRALAIALRQHGLEVAEEQMISVTFRGFTIGTFYADLIVGGVILVEVKSSSTIEKYAEAQILNYLKAAGVSDFLCAGRVKSNAGGRCGKPRSVRFSKWLWTRSWRP